MKIKCKNCQSVIIDNPKKHRYRDKFCPHCLQPYKIHWSNWKPNLQWVKQKLENILRKKEAKEKG